MITLISRFNTGNLGDIAIANAIKDELKAYDPFCISLFSPLLKTNNSTDMGGTSKLLRKIGREFDMRYINNIIEEDSIMVFGGGNMLSDIHATSDSVKRYRPFFDIAKTHNCRCIASNIGFGPFATKEQKERAVELLSMCTAISFRDQNSKDCFLSDYTGSVLIIEKSVDPVFFYGKKVNRKKHQSTKIGINLIEPLALNYTEEDRTSIIMLYRLIANQLLTTTDYQLCFFVTDTIDKPMLQILKEEFAENNRVEFSMPNSVNVLYKLYDSFDLVIGTRMHSMIVACANSLPIIGFSWQAKVSDLFNLMECENRCMPLLCSELDVNAFINECVYVMNHYDEEQKRIQRLYKKLELQYINTASLMERIESI